MSDAEGLASSVHETSNLSERVSKKVRELDLVQSRAQESVARINRLVSRTKAISGVLLELAKFGTGTRRNASCFRNT